MTAISNVVRSVVRNVLYSVTQKGGAILYLIWFRLYKARVTADSGTIQDTDLTKEIFEHLQNNDTYDNTLLLITPEGGIKTRASGSNTFVTKEYDFADKYEYGTPIVSDSAAEDNTSDWTKTDCDIVFNENGYYEVQYTALTQYISQLITPLYSGKTVKFYERFLNIQNNIFIVINHCIGQILG
jgi:hypothetical protein